MHRTDLERHLRQHGCVLHHRGANHDIWLNPTNLHKVPVPGHKEIKEGTVRGICRILEISVPPGL